MNVVRKQSSHASKLLTFKWLDLIFAIWGRGKVPTEDEAGGRHCWIACNRHKRSLDEATNSTNLENTNGFVQSKTLEKCIKPENMVWIFSRTSTLSSHKSEIITNIASSFSSSICFSLAEDFTVMVDGPPKKFTLP